MKRRILLFSPGAELRRMAAPVLAVLLSLGLVTFTACELMIDTRPSGSARLEVRLVDSPFPFELVDEVNVEISRVEIQSRDNGTITITDDDEVYNLLDLRDGVSALLGEVVIEPGRYDQIRVWVEDADILLTDGRRFDIKVPSERVRVLLNDFRIDDEDDLVLTLDFDVEESFVVLGNPDTPAGINGFIFKPTIKPIDDDGRGDDNDRGRDDDDDGDDDGDGDDYDDEDDD